MTESRDDQLLAYLSGDLTPDERRAFQTRLASEPGLQNELAAWRSLAQARQRTFNAQGALERERAFLMQLDALHSELDSAAPTSADLAGQAKAPWSRGLLQRLRRGFRFSTSASPLFPVGWAVSAMLAVVVVMQSPWVDLHDTSVPTRGASGACFAISVNLPDQLTVSGLRDVLSQYLVTVAGGTDKTGHFTLLARRDTSLEAAAAALNADPVGAISRADCQAGQP